MGLKLEKARENYETRKKKQASSKYKEMLFQCFSDAKTKDTIIQCSMFRVIMKYWKLVMN